MISTSTLPSARPLPDPPPNAWPSYALAARVAEALDLALAALDQLAAAPRGEMPRSTVTALREIALLLRAVLALDAERYPALLATAQDVATALAGVARAPVVADELAWHPADARETAFAHLILTASGRPDPWFHARLGRALAAPTSRSGERLPHERLRHAWLALLEDRSIDALDVMADHTALASPIDLCAADAPSLHAVAEALRWVTDLGARAPRLARSPGVLIDELESALVIGLEHDDVALVASLLLAWPALRMPWSAPASFAFAWVVAREGTRRASIEASCALGTLAATTLAGPWRPLRDWPSETPHGPLWHMLRGRLDAPVVPSWLAVLDATPWPRQRGVTTLLLDAVLRRAIAAQELRAVRELLVAVEASGARGTALCQQAAALCARVDGDRPLVLA